MTPVHAWWAGWAHYPWAGWAHYPAPWGLSVAPLDDLWIHDVTAGPHACACGPVMVPVWLLDGSPAFSALHQSLDGRERGHTDDVHVS